MKQILLVAVIGLIGLGLLSGTAAAQSDPVISASADPTTVTTDDLVTLTVTVDRAAGASEPVLPALDGFSLLGTSSGTQISIVNGDMSVTMAYTYYLQPMQTGELVIGPFSTTANGQIYQTEPILITVAQGTGQFQPSIPSMPGMPSLGGLTPTLPNAPSGAPGQIPQTNGGTLDAPAELNGQEYYVEALVDRANPWQGEQVLYKFRFYQGSSLLVEPSFQPPDFTGFWHDRQAEQVTYTTEAGGRTYYVTEIQTVLFPTVSGQVTIGPSILEIPGGFFSNGQTLTTQPVNVDIRPLPDSPPADFTGAVGQFGLQALVDKTTSQVNDAVTLQVTLSGVGNIDTLGDLTWDVGPEWRAFDPQVESTSAFANGQLQGSRIYEQLLVPLVPGSLTVEPVNFSFFDPLVGAYQSIATQPILVQVSADTSGASQPLTAVGAASGGLNVPGLRPLKSPPSSWRSTSGVLVEKTGYWALFAVPLLMLIGLTGLSVVNSYRQATSDDRRKSRAASQAYGALQQARKQPDTAAAAGARIMNTYLSTKLEEPTVGLTRQRLADLLRGSGISDSLVQRVETCLQDSETVAYYPGFSFAGADALLDEIEGTIRELESALT